MKKDVLAFKLIKEKFENDYNELNDTLYHYMITYFEGGIEHCLFKDEVENLLGIRDHEIVVEYILNI